MFTVKSLLSCCLSFQLIFLNEAKDIHFSPHSSIRFANFVEHKCRYLEVSKYLETRVQEFDDCAVECLETSSCISLNTASSRDQENRFWCELLLSDMFNNSENFRDNATSHHFSKWVSLCNIVITDIMIRSFGNISISIYKHPKKFALRPPEFSFFAALVLNKDTSFKS